LDEAFTRALDSHPDLKMFPYSASALAADVDRAGMRPPIVASALAENVLGTGAASGFKAAELTVSLASVIERGGKLDARLALARNRQDAAAATRDAKRLDVLAEVARRFLDIVAAQANERIANEDIAQRERTVTAAARRVAAGASPESVRLAAEAQRARAQMERRRAERDQVAAYRRLALLWGERNPRAALVAGDRLSVPDVPDFDAIAALLERTPELQRFADEARIREARLQLARTSRTPDVEWQIGVRRLQETSDWALVGSVSLPLGSAARAAPEIRSAQAELAALDFERESSELTLYATLAQAHARLAASVADARELDEELLPRLRSAEAAAEKAYRAGALSYLEWAQLQSETTVARRQQLADTIDAQRALIEIQRLTGATFGAANHAEAENSP
jgi:cobalt-zinc-cadmium efflux system outer membrane protein